MSGNSIPFFASRSIINTPVQTNAYVSLTPLPLNSPIGAHACIACSLQTLPGGALGRTLLRIWKTFTSWWSTSPPTSTPALRGLNRFFAGSSLLWCTVCLYAATFPRLHGGRLLAETREDLPYWQRLLAIFTLGMVRGDRKNRPSSCVIRGFDLLRMKSGMWAASGCMCQLERKYMYYLCQKRHHRQDPRPLSTRFRTTTRAPPAAPKESDPRLSLIIAPLPTPLMSLQSLVIRVFRTSTGMRWRHRRLPVFDGVLSLRGVGISRFRGRILRVDLPPGARGAVQGVSASQRDRA